MEMNLMYDADRRYVFVDIIDLIWREKRGVASLACRNFDVVK